MPDAPDGEVHYGAIVFFLVMVIGSALFVPVRNYLARRRRKRGQPRDTAGEAPDSAIAVPGTSEAHAALRRIRCCDDEPFARGLPKPQQLRYDGKELTVYRRACAACGRNHARYFVVK